VRNIRGFVFVREEELSKAEESYKKPKAYRPEKAAPAAPTGPAMTENKILPHTSWTLSGSDHDVVIHAPHPEGRLHPHGSGDFGTNEGSTAHKTKFAVWSHSNKRAQGGGYPARHVGDFGSKPEAVRAAHEAHKGAAPERFSDRRPNEKPHDILGVKKV
jgi:hypothetical protein